MQATSKSIAMSIYSIRIIDFQGRTCSPQLVLQVATNPLGNSIGLGVAYTTNPQQPGILTHSGISHSKAGMYPKGEG